MRTARGQEKPRAVFRGCLSFSGLRSESACLTSLKRTTRLD
ncbi:hypothetical protein [Paraburkholderia xenovorans]|nr:hypothetical protein [Paraburkholderia xenovorans]